MTSDALQRVERREKDIQRLVASVLSADIRQVALVALTRDDVTQEDAQAIDTMLSMLERVADDA